MNVVERTDGFERTRAWPDPTPEMLDDPAFEAIWKTIKRWDINVPDVDGPGMYSGATGNHVRAILDALRSGNLIAEKKVGAPRHWRIGFDLFIGGWAGATMMMMFGSPALFTATFFALLCFGIGELVTRKWRQTP